MRGVSEEERMPVMFPRSLLMRFTHWQSLPAIVRGDRDCCNKEGQIQMEPPQTGFLSKKQSLQVLNPLNGLNKGVK